MTDKKRPKKPSMKDKVEVYEKLLQDLTFHLDLTQRRDKVDELLQKIRHWGNSNYKPSGLKYDVAAEDRANEAFWKLKE